VALLGPRQAGKTTIAREISAGQGGRVYDLENPVDSARLTAPMRTLEQLSGLVVLDEIQLRPDLVPILRVLADREPLPARFLILGSAAPELLKNASETLAGRVEFIEIGGFQLADIGIEKQRQLWLRGGFPMAWLPARDADSMAWRMNFIRTFLERDLRTFGVEVTPAAMRRLWQMLAHYHGGVWNASEFGRSLGESYKTTRRHLDILTGAFMVRQLQPWFENSGKRLVRHPKVYIRDTGLLHALLHLESQEDVEGHPKCGASWEGFCVEQILQRTGERNAFFWAAHSGAELDLLLLHHGRRVGIEFKYSDAPRATKSMHAAMDALRLDHLHVVYPGEAEYELNDQMTARPLWRMLEELLIPPPEGTSPSPL